jgi:Cu2+-exporting ATPase
MASHSKHPLSLAIAGDGEAVNLPELIVTDLPGKGTKASWGRELIWMGKASWLGVPDSADAQMEVWFKRGQAPAVRLVFADAVRADAASVVAALHQRGIQVCMLSGDRAAVAQGVAEELDISRVHAELSPVDKVALIEQMSGDGRKVLMVGDGLNDAAALTAALVSMSPATGVDVTQNAADLVYRGAGLQAIVTALDTARAARSLVRQNVFLSVIYNCIAVPIAVLGLVTPLIAAVAMSASSLVVVANSLRLKQGPRA